MSAFKVVRFLAPDGVAGDRWSRWRVALDGTPAAEGRPGRVAVGEALDLGGAGAPFGAVDVQWFADLESALANPEWLVGAGLEAASDSPVVVADEVVLRGQGWLADRWASGGERYKMLSFGRRHPDLSPQEFSERWRREAGQLGGGEIPAEVRGQAYVQNHPIPIPIPVQDRGREWPFDAVNEVWFDRLDDLRRRRDWFAQRLGQALRSAAEPLMSPGQVWSMFVREVPV
jgi:hypothetical protein